jgi:hypothetical protein
LHILEIDESVLFLKRFKESFLVMLGSAFERVLRCYLAGASISIVEGSLA